MADSHFQKLLDQLRAEHERELAKLHAANRQLSKQLDDDGECIRRETSSVRLSQSKASGNWVQDPSRYDAEVVCYGSLVRPEDDLPGTVNGNIPKPESFEANVSPLRKPSLEPAPLLLSDPTESDMLFSSGMMSKDPDSPRSIGILRNSTTSTNARVRIKAQHTVSFSDDAQSEDATTGTGCTSSPPSFMPHNSLSGKATQGKMYKKGNMLVSMLNGRDPVFLQKCSFMAWHNHTRLVRNPIIFSILPSLDMFKEYGNGCVSYAVAQYASDDAEKSEGVNDEDETIRSNGWMGRYMISPGSRTRIMWDLVATSLLAYDMFMIPLSAFTLGRGDFLTIMDWFSLVFWTIDMLMSCITGVFVDGIVVLEPVITIVTYLRTWFILDVCVNVPDWIFTIIATTSDSSIDAAESGKLLRAARVFRTVRLLRLAKLQKVLIMLRDCIETEMTFLCISILKLVGMLVMLNHFIAAIWWSIGSIARHAGGPNWIDSIGIYHDTLLYRYLTSLHWSICMFTPGSMDVQPYNSGERSFAILVLVSGMVVFTSFISSMTAAIAQLKKMQCSDSKDIWMLRRFLRQHNIGPELSFRVLRYVDNVVKLQDSRKVAPDKVWAMQILSDQLRTEVQFEAMFSCLNAHPLFEHMCTISKGSMIKLVGTALCSKPLGLGDVLFNSGAQGTHMHLVSGGKLIYRRTNNDDSDDKGQRAETDDWFCEPVLWTKWTHLGIATATQECDLVGIHSANFIETLKWDSRLMEDVYNYACHFVENLSTIPYGNLTDLSKAWRASKMVEEFLTAALESTGGAWLSAMGTFDMQHSLRLSNESWQQQQQRVSNGRASVHGRASVRHSRRRSGVGDMLSSMVKRRMDEMRSMSSEDSVHRK